MPRYFFDIDADRMDAIGLDLPDRRTARAEAIRAAGEILRDIDGHLSGKGWTMIVRDESRQDVMELRFSVIEKFVP